MLESRDIPGYEGIYQVREDGEVFRIAGGSGSRPGVALKHYLTNYGYHSVHLSRNAKVHGFLVHRLLAMAFIPNPEGLPYVRHLNDVKLDNRLLNLAWGTQQDNMDDMALNHGHWATKKTHCKNGHEFTPENTYTAPKQPGTRSCKACHKIRSNEWWERNHA